MTNSISVENFAKYLFSEGYVKVIYYYKIPVKNKYFRLVLKGARRCIIEKYRSMITSYDLYRLCNHKGKSWERLQILKHLLKIIPFSKDVYSACTENGHEFIYEWLMKKGYPSEPHFASILLAISLGHSVDEKLVFYKSCEYGNIKALQKLKENGFIMNSFSDALYHGKLEVLKWAKENGFL